MKLFQVFKVKADNTMINAIASSFGKDSKNLTEDDISECLNSKLLLCDAKRVANKVWGFYNPETKKIKISLNECAKENQVESFNIDGSKFGIQITFQDSSYTTIEQVTEQALDVPVIEATVPENTHVLFIYSDIKCGGQRLVLFRGSIKLDSFK